MKKNSTQLLLFSLCFFLSNNIFYAQNNFNYSEALNKSIEFYDAQICGPQPSWSRATWRNDCHMNDGSDIGKNLTGGWHDAGDHTKFNYVSAQATRVLAWSYLQYKNSFDGTGSTTSLLNHLRLSGDFMIKLHPSPNVFYAQIGRAKTGSNPEHNEWVAPSQQSARIDRSVTTINTSNPGTHMACSNAAAFASLSMVFKDVDPTYSATLLQHAKDLFAFGDRNRGDHYNLLGSPEPYPMNSFDDDLFIGAVWLYKATNDNSYLTKAETEYEKVRNSSGWMMHYRDHAFEGFLLMSQIRGEDKYYMSTEQWLDGEIDGAPTTNAGMYYRSDFLSASLATSMGFAAYFYAELRGSGFSKYNKYRTFAFRQINYVLGDNPRGSSYVVGFGNNPPTITHHRAASGVPQASTEDDRHELTGALVGGPNSDDSYTAVRSSVKTTEPAISNQAFFVGMAAMLVKETGVPDTTEGSVEIENNFSVFNDAGANGSVGRDTFNAGASAGAFVRLFDTNDELSTTFTVSEAGDYRLEVRLRVGEQSGTTSNLADKYEIRIDGTVRNFNLVNNSISELDGDTYWGELRRTQNLSAGTHTVRIKATANWLKADRLNFEKVSSSFTDQISSVSNPDSVTPGSTATVTVNYEAAQERDVVVIFQKDSPDFDTYGEGRVRVSAGSGTVEVDVPISASTPVANDAYQFQTIVTTVGGNYDSRKASLAKTNIDCISSGGGSEIVTIRARMINGTSDQLQLRVNNTTVHTWTINNGNFTNYTFDIESGGNIKLYFPDNGTDLEVDWLRIGNTTYQAEAQEDNTSVYQGQCGGSFSQVMHCRGHIDFGTINVGTLQSGNIVVRAKGDCGEESMQLRVDDTTVLTRTVTTTYTNYTYSGYSSGTVSVHFVNDGSTNTCTDKNLYIDYIDVCGTRIQSESGAVTQNSTYTNGDKQILFTNGDNNYGNPGCSSARSAALVEEPIKYDLTNIVLYPNPVSNGTVTIKGYPKGNVKIYDINGRQLMERTDLSDSEVLDISVLQSGLYLVKLSNHKNSDATTSLRLIVE